MYVGGLTRSDGPKECTGTVVVVVVVGCCSKSRTGRESVRRTVGCQLGPEFHTVRELCLVDPLLFAPKPRKVPVLTGLGWDS